MYKLLTLLTPLTLLTLRKLCHLGEAPRILVKTECCAEHSSFNEMNASVLIPVQRNFATFSMHARCAGEAAAPVGAASEALACCRLNSASLRDLGDFQAANVGLLDVLASSFSREFLS